MFALITKQCAPHAEITMIWIRSGYDVSRDRYSHDLTVFYIHEGEETNSSFHEYTPTPFFDWRLLSKKAQVFFQLLYSEARPEALEL